MAGSLLGNGFGTVALQADAGGIVAAFGMILAVTGLLGLVAVAGAWKTFTKAGQPGWAAIVPFYNVYVLVVEIAERDTLWVVLGILVPPLLVVPMIDVAEKFGKGAGYGVGLAFLGFVFFPLLGFGDARYRGTSAAI